MPSFVGRNRRRKSLHRCTGFKMFFDSEREDDRLMVELVAGYVAIIAYNAVVLMAQKYRDIETAQDDARRAIREENQLHVQNLVFGQLFVHHYMKQFIILIK